eukprot:8143022-Alexandrium_andersonii.AAC.1
MLMMNGCQKLQPVTKKKDVSDITFVTTQINRHGETQALSTIPHPLGADGGLADAARDNGRRAVDGHRSCMTGFSTGLV